MKLNSYQITALKKHRLTRIAVARLLSRSKIDLQRTFFQMKMNAQLLKFNEQVEETIKIRTQKFVEEKKATQKSRRALFFRLTPVLCFVKMSKRNSSFTYAPSSLHMNRAMLQRKEKLRVCT